MHADCITVRPRVPVGGHRRMKCYRMECQQKANQQLERWISFKMMLIVSNVLLQLSLVMLNDDAPDWIFVTCLASCSNSCALQKSHTFCIYPTEEHRRQGSEATSLSFEDSPRFSRKLLVWIVSFIRAARRSSTELLLLLEHFPTEPLSSAILTWRPPEDARPPLLWFSLFFL